MASCESHVLVSIRAGVDSYQAAVAIDRNRQRVARTPRDGEHVFLTASQTVRTTHTANGLTVDWSPRRRVFQSAKLSIAHPSHPLMGA